MEVVIDFEFVKGCQVEFVVKEHSVSANNMNDSFPFQEPLYHNPTRLGRIRTQLGGRAQAHHDLYTVVSESVTGIAHLYCYVITKCKFLTELFVRPILNLQDFNCPKPSSFNHTLCCSLPCFKFPNVVCATKTAHSFYDWLMYHLQTKSYVKCPKYMSRHSCKFFSAA